MRKKGKKRLVALFCLALVFFSSLIASTTASLIRKNNNRLLFGKRKIGNCCNKFYDHNNIRIFNQYGGAIEDAKFEENEKNNLFSFQNKLNRFIAQNLKKIGKGIEDLGDQISQRQFSQNQFNHNIPHDNGDLSMENTIQNVVNKIASQLSPSPEQKQQQEQNNNNNTSFLNNKQEQYKSLKKSNLNEIFGNLIDILDNEENALTQQKILYFLPIKFQSFLKEMLFLSHQPGRRPRLALIIVCYALLLSAIWENVLLRKIAIPILVLGTLLLIASEEAFHEEFVKTMRKRAINFIGSMDYGGRVISRSRRKHRHKIPVDLNSNSNSNSNSNRHNKQEFDGISAKSMINVLLSQGWSFPTGPLLSSLFYEKINAAMKSIQISNITRVELEGLNLGSKPPKFMVTRIVTARFGNNNNNNNDNNIINNNDNNIINNNDNNYNNVMMNQSSSFFVNNDNKFGRNNYNDNYNDNLPIREEEDPLYLSENGQLLKSKNSTAPVLPSSPLPSSPLPSSPSSLSLTVYKEDTVVKNGFFKMIFNKILRNNNIKKNGNNNLLLLQQQQEKQEYYPSSAEKEKLIIEDGNKDIKRREKRKEQRKVRNRGGETRKRTRRTRKRHFSSFDDYNNQQKKDDIAIENVDIHNCNIEFFQKLVNNTNIVSNHNNKTSAVLIETKIDFQSPDAEVMVSIQHFGRRLFGDWIFGNSNGRRLSKKLLGINKNNDNSDSHIIIKNISFHGNLLVGIIFTKEYPYYQLQFAFSKQPLIKFDIEPRGQLPSFLVLTGLKQALLYGTHRALTMMIDPHFVSVIDYNNNNFASSGSSNGIGPI